MTTPPMTTSNTITMTTGERYRVRTADELARLNGPIVLRKDIDSGWSSEHDGPLIAWFALTPQGWKHKDSGRINASVIFLSLDILRERQAIAR